MFFKSWLLPHYMDKKESSKRYKFMSYLHLTFLNNSNYKKQPQPSSPAMVVVARQPDIAAIHTFLPGRAATRCRLVANLPIASRPYSHSGGVPSVELPARAALARVADSYTDFFFVFAPGLQHPREQKQKWLIKRGETSQPDVGGLNPLCHFSSEKHLNTLHTALTVLR